MGKAPTRHDSNELIFWGRQDSGDNAKEQLLGIRRGQSIEKVQGSDYSVTITITDTKHKSLCLQ